MGTIRFIEVAGCDYGLYDHEGYMLAQLDGPAEPYTEAVGTGVELSWWTSTSSTETRRRDATGWHRPACACGWRGTPVLTDVLDIWLPEAIEDEIMFEWMAHTDPFLAELEHGESANVLKRGAAVDICDQLLKALDEELARVSWGDNRAALTFNAGVADGLARATLIVRAARSAAHATRS
jgi:hypothetical protein